MSVVRSQASIKRGQTASYVVSVWTTDGSASGVTLKLAGAPSSQKAKFTLGCGSKDDGTAACDVGTVDSTSAARQLEAQIAVASSASSVTSVKLTATAAATDVKTDPAADATVSVTAASSASPSASPSASSSPSSTDDYAAGDDATLPSLNGSGSSYTSGAGNASGLFPTINPSSDPSPSTSTSASDKLSAEPAADTTTLPLGTPVVGAQIVGLGALALACGLAVTRLSLRRRPAQKKPEE
ncbi:MAG: hypothetical protein ABSA93_35410 [Streptosporangiaceae bacterium]